MIVLDTNVVSELVRPRPSQAVIDWLDAINSSDVMVTALTAAEVRVGVALLPSGRRKRDIGDQVEALLTETFAGHVLPFDLESAAHYAAIVGSRTRVGRPISLVDAQIAAVCRQHESVLATRNVRDFLHTGLKVLNPWNVGDTLPGSPRPSDG